MDDGQLLSRAIKSRPGEWTLRLVYADWLQENGQPERAELIRLSSPARPPPDESERDGRSKRVEQILRAEDNFRSQLNATVLRVELRDGMPFLHLDIVNFFQHIEALLDAHPDIVGVKIVDDVRDGTLRDRLVRSPLLENFNHLTLTGLTDLRDDAVEALAGNQAVGRLTHLSLPDHEMSDAGARAIASSPHLRKLTSLSVRRGRMTGEGFVALSNGGYAASLEELDFGFCCLTDEAVQSFVVDGSPLPYLKKLDLYGNWTTCDSFVSLAESPRLPPETLLKVSGDNGRSFVGKVENLRARTIRLGVGSSR